MKKIFASFVMSVLTAAVLASSCLAAQSETEVRQVLAKTFPGIKVRGDQRLRHPGAL